MLSMRKHDTRAVYLRILSLLIASDEAVSFAKHFRKLSCPLNHRSSPLRAFYSPHHFQQNNRLSPFSFLIR